MQINSMFKHYHYNKMRHKFLVSLGRSLYLAVSEHTGFGVCGGLLQVQEL